MKFLGSSYVAKLIYGDTAASGTLTLSSTSNGTKGKILFGPGNTVYDEVNDRFGIGVTAPSALFSVGTSSAFTVNSSGNIVTSGDLTVNGNTVLGNASSDSITLAGTVIPGVTFNDGISNVTTVVLKGGTPASGGTTYSAIMTDASNIPQIRFSPYNGYYGFALIDFPTGNGGFDFFNYRTFSTSGTYDYVWKSKNSGGASSDRLKITGNLDIAYSQFSNSLVSITNTNTPITPTALLHAGPCTTAYANLRVEGGTAPSSPNNGDMWNDSSHLKVRLSGVTYQLDQQTSFSYTTTLVTSTTYNETATTGDKSILVDAATAGGTVTVNLPTAVSNTARFTIKKIDSGVNTIIVDASSTQTIDGSLTIVLYSQYESVTLVNDNANWYII